MRALVVWALLASTAHAQGTATSSLVTPLSASDLSQAVQAVTVITDASGAWSVTWARPFVSATPVVTPLPVNNGTMPILCNVAARSTSTASGKCWQSTSTTITGTIGMLLSTVASPFANPAGGSSVMIIGREPTQP